MDDLYGNAWGDSDHSNDAAFGHTHPTPSWISPKAPTQEEDADLAAPSWVAGADIQWTEPSDEPSGFTWSATESDQTWEIHSTYNDISIIPNESAKVAEPSTPEFTSTEVEDTTESSPSSPEPRSPSVERPFGFLELEPPQLPTASLSRSSSPDGFGTFETAFESQASGLSATLSPGIEDEPWGSPWVETSDAVDVEESKPADEWETARKQKERLDRMIVSLSSQA